MFIFPHNVFVLWGIAFFSASPETNGPNKKGCESNVGDGFFHGAFENSTNNRTGWKMGIAELEKLVKFVVLCYIRCSAFDTISFLACLPFGWPFST